VRASATYAVVALRAAVGILLAVHGVYRILDGGVSGFGEFLSGQHVPLGPVVAWLLTAVEVVGGPALALGFLVPPLCAWFVAEQVMGIILVHSREGWFVVGGGRNGMEYSVLLIVGFVVTAVLDRERRSGAPAA